MPRGEWRGRPRNSSLGNPTPGPRASQQSQQWSSNLSDNGSARMSPTPSFSSLPSVSVHQRSFSYAGLPSGYRSSGDASPSPLSPLLRRELGTQVSKDHDIKVDAATLAKRNFSESALSSYQAQGSDAPTKLTANEFESAKFSYYKHRLDKYTDSKEKELECHTNALLHLKEVFYGETPAIARNDYNKQFQALLTSILDTKATLVALKEQSAKMVGFMIDNERFQSEEETNDWSLIDSIIRLYKEPAGAQQSIKMPPRTPDVQERYRRRAIKAYDTEVAPMKFWCVISGTAINPSMLRVAHIVPQNVGEVHANYLFGEAADKRIGHLMSPQNSLPIFTPYEELLDSARIAIVPENLDSTREIDWKVVVLDPTFLEEDSVYSLPWGKQLDGLSLKFRNDFRPKARYLYFSFVVNALRRQRCNAPGWWDTIHSHLDAPMWATPGEWIRTSTLRRLSRRMGHAMDFHNPLDTVTDHGSPEVNDENLLQDTVIADKFDTNVFETLCEGETDEDGHDWSEDEVCEEDGCVFTDDV
ncbi:hypothetical protein F4781DRAFT_435013 [Annulohypoxylon bovei var. microspora]|nr:hypothetical protein F4781DRAFT_435013 [Annulohypoxylon bovei var. microspora]